jgi:uncharacterized protein (DUF1697 family)
MPGYGAFLRGVNLGAKRRVSSAQLRDLFEGLGFGDVNPFRTSGNVAFSAGREARGKLESSIGKALTKSLGYDVVVFVRTEAEIEAIATKQPFARKVTDASKGKLQVLLLPVAPAAAKQKSVLKLATDQDRLAFGPRELYWLPSGGTQQTTMDLKAIEKLVGPTTMRTKGTIELMTEKFFTR